MKISINKKHKFVDAPEGFIEVFGTVGLGNNASNTISKILFQPVDKKRSIYKAVHYNSVVSNEEGYFDINTFIDIDGDCYKTTYLMVLFDKEMVSFRHIGHTAVWIKVISPIKGRVDHKIYKTGELVLDDINDICSFASCSWGHKDIKELHNSVVSVDVFSLNQACLHNSLLHLHNKGLHVKRTLNSRLIQPHELLSIKYTRKNKETLTFQKVFIPTDLYSPLTIWEFVEEI